MKEQIIQIPDTLEIKEIKDGKIILVEKEKKLTYEDVMNELFFRGNVYFMSATGNIIKSSVRAIVGLSDVNNAKSERQLEKLGAINKLMNVAKYLNGDWQPDWNNGEEDKYYFQIETLTDELDIDCTNLFNRFIAYFKSRKLAQKAIEILGEETIRLALDTDY